jgi:hypothetical protein
MTHTSCTYGHPCSAHRAEALAAASAAEALYRASRIHLPARDVARGAQGASQAAYDAALVRPTTPCSDGSPCAVGWPDQ